jgi:hypothetical protein
MIEDNGVGVEYHKADHFLERKIISSLETGEFPHLKNPNNKSRGNCEFMNLRARFRIFLRPPHKRVVGLRRLNHGDNEVLLFLHGLFNEEENFNSGFDMACENGFYRIALGRFFSDYTLSQELMESTKDLLKFGGLDFLYMGRYDSFLKNTLNAYNENIGIYKEIAQERGNISV